MTASIVNLSEARARRQQTRIWPEDRTLSAWLSSEHTAVMGPHKPTLPCERVPADLIEMPCDTE